MCLTVMVPGIEVMVPYKLRWFTGFMLSRKSPISSIDTVIVPFILIDITQPVSEIFLQS